MHSQTHFMKEFLLSSAKLQNHKFSRRFLLVFLIVFSNGQHGRHLAHVLSLCLCVFSCLCNIWGEEEGVCCSLSTIGLKEEAWVRGPLIYPHLVPIPLLSVGPCISVSLAFLKNRSKLIWLLFFTLQKRAVRII